MEHTLWCGLERAEKVSYGCTKYELRGVSLLDTRVLLGQPLDYRFVCVPILRVRSCTIGCASRGGCAAVLSFRCRCVAGRRALPHLAAVHAVLTDFCLQGPLSPKFSAPAAGTGRGRWRSKTRVKSRRIRASVRSGDPPRAAGRCHFEERIWSTCSTSTFPPLRPKTL